MPRDDHPTQHRTEKGLRFAPRHAAALVLQGFQLCARTRTPEALDTFDRALALDPGLGNAWLGRGLCRFRLGDVQGGLEDLETAAALEPQRALLRSYLAKAFATAGNTDRAEKEFALAKEMDPNDLLTLECDILLPSALENAITLNNVGRVKTKIIAELANGPTTPGADRVLEDEGVFLIPDILANAGGVTVSYYEWVQDQYSFFWSEQKINDTLETTIHTAFDSVHETAKRYNTDMRTGAYILAVGRVAEATSVRGIFP